MRERFTDSFSGAETRDAFEVQWRVRTLNDRKTKKLPLFLEGDSYVIWDELSDGDKKDPAKVKEALEAAFSLTAAQSYRAFRKRKLHGEESVDRYTATADRRRLLKMSAQDVAADGKNRVVIEQFLSGLPTVYARQARTNAETDTIQKCVTYVRKLRSAERPSGTADGMAAASMGHGSQAKFLCYECNKPSSCAMNATSQDIEPGHRAKEFPKKRAYQRK